MVRTVPYIAKGQKAQHRYCIMFSKQHKCGYWMTFYLETPRTTRKTITEISTRWCQNWPYGNLQTSMFSMYLDLSQTFHLSFDINQLHFIQCISVLRSFYHCFYCCNETFSAPLIARLIVRSHLLLCVHTQSCVPSTLSPAHDRFTIYWST